MSEVEGTPRRWSATRIASAAVLAIVILGAIAYGIYSWVNSGGNGKHNQTASNSVTNSSANNNNLAQPFPKSNKSNGSSSTGGAGSTSANNSASNQSAANSTTQLSNTGPGDTALIGFMAATIVGTAVHYGWRKLRANS